MPTMSNVDKAVLDAPTKLRTTSLNPNEVNSLRTLWNLKIQTYATDRAIESCTIFIKSIIVFYLRCY